MKELKNFIEIPDRPGRSSVPETDDSLNVLLIDPSYDKIEISTPCIPLGLGLIGSYLLEQVPNIELKVLKLMSEILDYINNEKPDILGITNYMWNTNLSVKISKIAQAVNPDILLVFGGPEINRKHMEKERFIRLYSHADLLVEKEGELAFTNIVQTYLRLNKDRI